MGQIKDTFNQTGLLREGLNLELKNWIDPRTPEGISKVAKTCMAMRNNDSGTLVIGFNNTTGQPDPRPANYDHEMLFHSDEIQKIVGKYASEPFEIQVEFEEFNGNKHPIIYIPPGVRTPSVSKAKLEDTTSKPAKQLIKENMVYVRSLKSNNTPSTTEASWKDWPKIIEICLENREADIGRFVRRHLSNISPEAASRLANAFAFGSPAKSSPTLEEQAKSFLENGNQRFLEATKDKSLPPHGSWEVAFLISGETPIAHKADKNFLSLIGSSNPRYTGWPIWLDSTGFLNREEWPYTHSGAWEALIITYDLPSKKIDFWRIEPTGEFYLRRPLEDDMEHKFPKPMTVFEPFLMVCRMTEAIATAIEFAKAMSYNAETTLLVFSFRWSGLMKRQLIGWAHPGRMLQTRTTRQNTVDSNITVPLSISKTAIPSYVHSAIEPLLLTFEGFDLGEDIINELCMKVLDRRL